MIAAYVTQSVDLTSSADEAFREWATQKYPELYEVLVKEAKELNCTIQAPAKEYIDYKKNEDGTHDALAFLDVLHQCLMNDNIVAPEQAAGVKQRLYELFDIPEDERTLE